MLSTARGSTRIAVPIIVAALIAIGAIWYTVATSGDRDSRILRTYHCNACDKDFVVDLNRLGVGKPTCPDCSGTDVVLLKTPE